MLTQYIQIIKEKYNQNGLIYTLYYCVTILLGIIRRQLVKVKIIFIQSYYLIRLKFYRFKKGFTVSDMIKVGYAVRSITILNYKYEKYLVTADVGDDTVSFVPIKNNKLMKRKVLRFPERSAPMGVKNVNLRNNTDDVLLITTFNYDDQNIHGNATSLFMIKSIDDLFVSLKNDPNQIYQDIETILQRRGFWGFRCVTTYKEIDGTNYIAAVDRNEDLLHIIELKQGITEIKNGNYNEFSLSQGKERSEPIYATIIPSTDGSPIICVNFRSNNELTLLKKNNEKFEIIKNIDVQEASRSYIASGNFRDKNHYDIAVALWGGDTKDLDSIKYGKLVIILQDENQEYNRVVSLEAGVHPTDVVAGDFDGDGLDELAVLNYGNGLNITRRTHTGGIQFFKYLNKDFKEIDRLNIPSPRIGFTYDIDNDGKDELIVSLFYEKRLVVIKQI